MTNSNKPVEDETDEAIGFLREALETIRFGSVEFIIHDGRVLQVDRKEKLRFEPSADDKRVRQGK